MLIDTHCHLDADAFADDRAAVMTRAQRAGVRRLVIPAVAPYNFDAVRTLAHQYPGGTYALGIHPLCIPAATEGDLDLLDEALSRHIHDPALVAVGEIGLDYFVPELKTAVMQEKQERFYQAQLRLAAKHDLPVILHVRRSQDRILKYLRQQSGLTGIAHAFNGSMQQAERFIDLGFALGAGGAMTYSRARQIRRLVAHFPLEHWVLETDAPDIPPAWLTARNGGERRNEPAELAGIAQAVAEVRAETLGRIIAVTASTAYRVLPRLALSATPEAV